MPRRSRNKRRPLNQRQRNAFVTLRARLKSYGIGGLSDDIRRMLVDGMSSSEIRLALQETKAWKQRFKGNEILQRKGLPVLSVAEYLSVEKSYAQIAKNYGLPQGFWDEPQDFAKLIGNSVSATEWEERVSMRADIANRQDPAITAQLNALGMNLGDLTAFIMDPKRANPLLKQKYQQVTLGAAARRTGLEAGAGYLAKLAGMGITEEQAQQGYGVIAENLDAVQDLGDVYGEDYSQRDFEKEVFEADAESTRKRKRLASQERASFGGSSGVGRGSLGSTSSGSY